MSKRLLIALAASLLSLGLWAQNLPDVTVQDVNGRSVSTLSMIDGQTPFIVTFWASWCRPCMEELAAIEDAAPDWTGDFPLRIYAVSVDDSRSLSNAKAVAASNDWPVTVLFDTRQQFKQAFRISSIPQVFIFDKNGRQVYTHLGFVPGGEIELLEKLQEAK